MNRETSKQNMTAEKPSQSDIPELNDLPVEKDVTGGMSVSRPIDDSTTCL